MLKSCEFYKRFEVDTMLIQKIVESGMCFGVDLPLMLP